MVVTGSPQEIRSRIFWNRLGADVKGFERQLVVMILRRSYRQISKGIGQVGIEVYSFEQRSLGFRKLPLVHQHRAQSKASVRIPGLSLRHFAIQLFGNIVFLSQRSRARKIAPGFTIVWVYLQDLRKLGYGIVIALTSHVQVAEPRVYRGVLRIGSNLPAQYIFRLIKFSLADQSSRKAVERGRKLRFDFQNLLVFFLRFSIVFLVQKNLTGRQARFKALLVP